MRKITWMLLILVLISTVCKADIVFLKDTDISQTKTRVGTEDTLYFIISDKIDSDTINTSNVKLFDEYGNTISGKVTYTYYPKENETYIYFDPDGPLAYGGEYDLTYSVTSSTGKSYQGTLSFTTKPKDLIKILNHYVYPNPFHGTTAILIYSLGFETDPSNVSVTIYDSNFNYFNEFTASSDGKIVLDFSSMKEDDVTSGVYFYVLSALDSYTGKIVKAKGRFAIVR